MKEADKNAYKVADSRKNEQIKSSCETLHEFIQISIKNWSVRDKNIYNNLFNTISKITAGNPYRNFDLMLEELGEVQRINAEVPAKRGLGLLRQLELIAKAIEVIVVEYNTQNDANLKLKRIEAPTK